MAFFALHVGKEEFTLYYEVNIRDIRRMARIDKKIIHTSNSPEKSLKYEEKKRRVQNWVDLGMYCTVTVLVSGRRDGRSKLQVFWTYSSTLLHICIVFAKGMPMKTKRQGGE